MEISCLNCDTKFTSKFCPACGQKAKTHRYTFAAIVHDIPHSFLHIDKGFFYTFKQLAIRPGKTIKEYLAGKRVNHFSPFAYLFLLCTANALVANFIVSIGTISNIDQMLFPGVVMFFWKYPALAYCSFIPFMSFWSWLFNRSKGYNYWENIVLNTYLIAQYIIILTLYRLLNITTGIEFRKVTVLLTIFFIYFGFAYWQFFGKVTNARGLVNRVLLYIMIILTVMTGLTITGGMSPFWPR